MKTLLDEGKRIAELCNNPPSPREMRRIAQERSDFSRLQVITGWTEKEILKTSVDAELSFKELGDLILAGKFPATQ